MLRQPRGPVGGGAGGFLARQGKVGLEKLVVGSWRKGQSCLSRWGKDRVWYRGRIKAREGSGS